MLVVPVVLGDRKRHLVMITRDIISVVDVLCVRVTCNHHQQQLPNSPLVVSTS